MISVKVYAYCWVCGAEHEVTDVGLPKKGERHEKICDRCGGVVVSSSGKGIFRVDDAN
ncbi:hypothetical protein [Effusibacillus consociatus]|uniref:ClpX-type ZB domain-containing protein n=1 Tax=Effusibacillus consociatus TaxID=1117041 RepID=A0ABV9PXA0_9BACL